MNNYKPKLGVDLHAWHHHNHHFDANNANRAITKKIKLGGIKSKNSYCKRFHKGLNDYYTSSTLHGLKYIGDKDITIGERIFWFIAFLSAVCMAIYFISKVYINYENSPVIVSFNPELVNVHDIPFPAITICNANVAMRNRAEIIKIHGTEEEKLVLEDLCRNNFTNSSDTISIPWTTVEDTIYNVTQRCTEMVSVCKWQGKIQDCHDLINSVITDDGYCCSFNKLPLTYSLREITTKRNLTFPDDILHWNPQDGYPTHANENVYPYRAFGRGIEQGLTLVLDADIDQYYCSTTSSIGFKILFATPLDSPKVADLGYLLMPGVEARIPINVEISDASESIEAVPWQKRKCIFPKERALLFYRLYSARNCMLECEANYTLTTCGCTTFDMPRKLDTKICGKADDFCIREARFHIERAGPDKDECKCLPGCFEIMYKPEIITLGNINGTIDDIRSEYLRNISQNYFSLNAAIVHFFYPVDKFQKQTKNTLYGFPEFLSQTGGLLGLFMGFSFLSVIEIFYFLFLRSTCKWIKHRFQTNTRPYMN